MLFNIRMKRFTINRSIRKILIAVGIYEALLSTNFLLAAIFTPVIFSMGSDAHRGDVGFILTGLGMTIIFWVVTPLSFALNWCMVFSKKTYHPEWFLWLTILPFIGLLTLSFLGLGFQPFIPFSFK